MQHFSSMIPAQGWLAAFASRDEDGKAQIQTRPVVAWVVVKNDRTDQQSRAEGLIITRYLRLAEDSPDFVAYVEEEEGWQERHPLLQRLAERVLEAQERLDADQE